MQSKRITTQTLLACVVVAAISPATGLTAGFDEQAGREIGSTLSIGDAPAAEFAAPVDDERSIIAPRESLALPEPLPVENATVIPDDPPGDTFSAVITDAGQDGADTVVIRQIRDQDQGLTTKVRADAILLYRGPPASRPLFTTYNEATATTGRTVFNGNQLFSNPLVAPRIAVERSDAFGHGVEGAFLYAGNFYAERTLPFASNGYAFAPPGIYGNTWGVNNTPLSAAQSTLLANLYSAEINLRDPWTFGATRFLVGFRWLQWGENWRMTDQFSDPLDPTVVGVDSYRTNCINNLYGGQIGLDTVLWNRGEGFRVESLVKAGAYYNAAAQSSAYDYSTNTGFAFSREIAVNGAGSCSFVGEVGVTAVVPLRQNLDLRCGYFGLWLAGIAQPLNQLSGQTLTQIDVPAGTLNTAGTVVVQGLSVALEGRW